MRSLRLLHRTYMEWRKDRGPQMAASTAYYAVFSLAPLLIIAIFITSLIFDENDVTSAVLAQMQSLLGTQGAAAVQSMIEAAQNTPDTPIAAFIGFLMLFLGASALLLSLQDSFNVIWNVQAKHTSNVFLILLFKRAFSFGIVLSFGFLFLISLFMSAAVSALITILGEAAQWTAFFLPLLNEVATFFSVLLLFGILFKYLPDIRIAWRDVLPGAALTAALYTIGKHILGAYLGRNDFTSVYGVAGSVIVLLFWIYYSAQILFFGAEFTKVSALEHGAIVEPKRYAQFVGGQAGEKKESRTWRTIKKFFAFLLFEWTVARWLRGIARWWKNSGT